MTTRFTEKLNTLNETLSLFDNFDLGPLADEIKQSCASSIVAVGSGGSLVAAQFFKRTLETLGSGLTSVQTPMEVVFSPTALSNTTVWLFSASADNSDIAAAVRSAIDRGSMRIVLCTRNGSGSVAQSVRSHGGVVVVFPVAVDKDGYLATHSLISTCVGLLLGSNQVAHANDLNLLFRLKDHVSDQIAARSEGHHQMSFAPLAKGAVLLLISDPALLPVATLLETSLWETSLCPVQLTDMRNFAHGRHTWPHHHDTHTLFLALTCSSSEPTWKSISDALPEDLPVRHESYASGGRYENLCGIIKGLFWIEAIGAMRGIDPGKPGIASYGRTIYGDDTLLSVAKALPAPVRQKLIAALYCDSPTQSASVIHRAYLEKFDTLTTCDIGAIVLDFDGTVVETDHRLEPPSRDVMDELVRLYELGVFIGFASGRGGSLGEQLRTTFPEQAHADILVGYFNGGHIVSAEIDIDQDRPIANPLIHQVADWLEKRPGLLKSRSFSPKEIQITIPHDIIKVPSRFLEDVQDCAPIAARLVRIVASGHSFDIIPATSSKLVIVEQMQHAIGPDKSVLSIGDCGDTDGNDYEFLARSFGVSVDRVCPEITGTWSLFGTLVTGPQALQKILAAMIPSSRGGIRLEASRLPLDNNG